MGGRCRVCCLCVPVPCAFAPRPLGGVFGCRIRRPSSMLCHRPPRTRGRIGLDCTQRHRYLLDRSRRSLHASTDEGQRQPTIGGRLGSIERRRPWSSDERPRQTFATRQGGPIEERGRSAGRRGDEDSGCSAEYPNDRLERSIGRPAFRLSIGRMSSCRSIDPSNVIVFRSGTTVRLRSKLRAERARSPGIAFQPSADRHRIAQGRSTSSLPLLPQRRLRRTHGQRRRSHPIGPYKAHEERPHRPLGVPA